MNTDSAVEALGELVSTDTDLRNEVRFTEWTAKALFILRAVFGATSPQVTEFQQAVRIKNEGYTTTRTNAIDSWRGDAAARGRAFLEAAIYALENITDEGSPLDEASIDPELWTHVQGLVIANDWAKIPAAVAIFVEDRIRIWAEDPRQSNGGVTVGKSLYGMVLNDTGHLRLGKQASEWEGWRFLGIGLAQAIGNVDRHRIQVRSDQRRYALGVLGLGSLLLTQVRYEHPAAIKNAEAQGLASREMTDKEPHVGSE